MGSSILRPWRDSAFRILAFSLLVATLALTAVVVLRSEVAGSFQRQGEAALGGHWVLSASRPPEAEQHTLLATAPHSQILEFQTVALFQDNFVLASVKAVDAHWPLIGTLEIARDRFSSLTEHVNHGPASGELWADDQLFDRLGVNVGDTLEVGNASLTVSARIVFDPSEGGNFYALNPKLLMSAEDLQRTAVLGPGSRYRHRTAVLDADGSLRQALEPTLRNDQRLRDVDEQLARQFGPLQQLTRWLSIGVLLITLLCGAAIYLASGLRLQRQSRRAALMRTFGASRNTILRQLFSQELSALLPAVLAGWLAGFGLAQLGLGVLGKDTQGLAPLTWLSVLLAPLVLYTAFATPKLLNLLAVPAMQVLRDNQPTPLNRLSLELAAALFGPLLLAALLTGSLAEVGRVMLGIALFALVLPLVVWPLLLLLKRREMSLNITTLLGLRRLSRHPVTTLPLLTALMLSLAILTLSGLAGSGLIQQWQRQLPQQAPNFFLFNLFDDDLPTVRAFIDSNQAQSQPLYPIVRARLTTINAVPVRDAVSKENEDAERTLNRDLALTESTELPASNRLAAGAWHGTGRTLEVSAETKVAESLGLQLGDVLEFTGASGSVSATLTSLREVDWDSFAPNFYFMFSQGAFNELDKTWLTSFWLPEQQQHNIPALIKSLPNSNLIDVNALLARGHELLRQATAATSLLAALMIIAALLVLSAAVVANHGQRKALLGLLQALGASHAAKQRLLLAEFGILALLATLLALLLAVLAWLPLAVLLLKGQWLWSLWWLLPIAGGLVIFAVGSYQGRIINARK